MLRFLAFLLGLILGYNGSGTAPEVPAQGASSKIGRETAQMARPEAPGIETAELRFPSFQVEHRGGLLHKA